MMLHQNRTFSLSPLSTGHNFPLTSGLFSGVDFKELFLYCYLFYGLLGDKLKLDAPLLGFIWLSLVALLVIKEKGHNDLQKIILGLIWLTGGILVTIQLFIFDLNVQENYVKPFLIWCLTAAVIFGFINRPNFFKRLTLVIFLIILISWSDISWDFEGRGIYRARAEATSFANPNSFAAWSGFCVLIFWLWSLVEPLRIIRVFLWVLTFLGLIITLQTVTRGTIGCLIVAFLLSLIPLPWKRKLVILFSCAAFAFIIQSSPFFQARMMDYDARGFKDTGRFTVMPVALDEISDNFWFGIGADKLDLYVLGSINITPHNSFLLIALGSGIFPLISFIILWTLVFWSAIKHRRKKDWINPFPLAIFVLGETLLSNLFFIEIWSVASMFYITGISKSRVPTYLPWKIKNDYMGKK